MRVFIIHGAYGNPEENWFPWLKGELEKEGHEVSVPRFPTPEDQTLDRWMEVFGEHMGRIGPDTVFVGHSLGPAFILRVLEKASVKVKACFFVAGFAGPLGNRHFDSINRTFVEKEFDWKKIRSSSGEFHVYTSDNDPYVHAKNAKKLADDLGCGLEVIKGAGHFNEAAGYTQFPTLLKDILKIR